MFAYARKRPPQSGTTVPQRSTSTTPAPKLVRDSRFQHDFTRVPTHSAELLGPDAELDLLLADITALTKSTAELRLKLDADPSNRTVAKELDAGRRALIEKLSIRITLLRPEIERLAAEGAGTGTMVGGTIETTYASVNYIRYQAELAQHESQLRRLTRWSRRRRIEDIDAELANTSLTAAQRDALAKEKESIAKSLTSTAHEYEQFDRRWAKKQYGKDKGCSTVKEGGCGPTSLATALTYLEAEDPESCAAGPELVTPDQTVPYAEEHGRWCGHGTIGDTMMKGVEAKWEKYRGRRLALSEVADHLRGGNLVIFLCKPCTGTTRSGKERRYGGHYMVLNGVDASGEVFDVLDSGDVESNDIVTMTKKELAKSLGFWIVERK